MFGLDQHSLIGIMLVLIGFLGASLIWFYLHKWLMARAATKMKWELTQNLPKSIEEIEADKRLVEARHHLELQHLQTRIAEIKLKEAEAEAKVADSLSKIDRLNHKIELLYLELVAKSVRDKKGKDKEVRADN